MPAILRKSEKNVAQNYLPGFCLCFIIPQDPSRVFSSSTLIHLNKDAFEVHLCQTVNNFVKQNKSHF